MAGAVAVTFCWLVELLQLTGLPAELSERSLAARLILGVQFDATDLAWYLVGVLPLVMLHAGVDRRRSHHIDDLDVLRHECRGTQAAVRRREVVRSDRERRLRAEYSVENAVCSAFQSPC
mgnify:CR=1 FL=1